MTVTAEDAARVLTLAKALDQYPRPEFSVDDADSWAMVLGRAGVRAEDAMEAVADWFGDPGNAGKRITLPAIVGKAKARMAKRLAGTTEVPFPPGLTWAQEQAWRQHWLDGLVKSDSHRLAVLYADRQLGVQRPEVPLVRHPEILGRVKELTRGQAE